ncbi:uncharacterized protein [Watersipora subatra]|uniref:uncharacterized protein n=1 Tax=Watersipora subatra TaxID=2589382 RepID=UPI00355C011A
MELSEVLSLSDVDPEFLVQAQQLFHNGSDIDANDFDVESETGSDSDESERAEGHDPRRPWGYAKFLSKRAVKRVKTPREAFEESLIKTEFEEVSGFFETEVAELLERCEREEMALLQVETSIDDIYRAALQKFDENPKVAISESEDIKNDYREYLEKAYRQTKVKLKHAYQMQKLQKEVKDLTVHLEDAHHQWLESDKNVQRANEELRVAKETLQKAAEDYEQQQKLDKERRAREQQKKAEEDYEWQQKLEKQRELIEELVKAKEDYKQQQTLDKEREAEEQLKKAKEEYKWQQDLDRKRKAREKMQRDLENCKFQQQLDRDAARYHDLLKEMEAKVLAVKREEENAVKHSQQVKALGKLRNDAEDDKAREKKAFEDKMNELSLGEATVFFAKKVGSAVVTVVENIGSVLQKPFS